MKSVAALQLVVGRRTRRRTFSSPSYGLMASQQHKMIVTSSEDVVQSMLCTCKKTIPVPRLRLERHIRFSRQPPRGRRVHIAISQKKIRPSRSCRSKRQLFNFSPLHVESRRVLIYSAWLPASEIRFSNAYDRVSAISRREDTGTISSCIKTRDAKIVSK